MCWDFCIGSVSYFRFGKTLHREINYDVKPGYLSVALKDKADDLTEAVFAVAVLGFAEIEKSNPKNVSVLNIRR